MSAALRARETCLDVWLKFDGPDADGDDYVSHEANTYRTPDGWYRVEWSHTEVGLISSSQLFTTYPEACAWLTANGYQDFTS